MPLLNKSCVNLHEAFSIPTDFALLDGKFLLIHFRDPSVDITLEALSPYSRVTPLHLLAVCVNSAILLIVACTRFGEPRHRGFTFVMDGSTEAERISS